MAGIGLWRPTVGSTGSGTALRCDDETVGDVCARKIDLQRLPSLVAVSSTLLTALAEPPGDFVYIRVAAALRRLEFA